MSAENGDAVVFAQPAPVNGDRSLTNGLTNGHSSSSSSSKHRSSSSSGGHKSSSKDKHRSSSSSSKSHHSSSGSSNKDKTSSSSSSRDKDKSSSGSSSAHKSSSSSSSSRDKDKDRHRDKHGGSSSSSSRDKDRKSSSGGHKSSSSSSKDHKSSSSGSSSRDKDKHRSSSSSGATAVVTPSTTEPGTDMQPPPVPSSSSSRDKDKSSSSSNHKSSSSSSKHKHSSSSSSSSSKHRSDKDKDRHRHSSSSSSSRKPGSSSSSSKEHKSSSSNHSSSKHNDIDAPIAADAAVTATDSPNNCVEVAVDDDPLAMPSSMPVKQEPMQHYNNSMNTSQASSCDYSMSQFKPDESQFSLKAEPEDDDDEENQQMSFGGGRGAVKHENDEDDDEEEDAPIAKRFKAVKTEQALDDDSDEDAPILAKKIKTEKVKKAKKKKHQSDDEDDDDYDDAPIVKKPKKEKKPKVVVKVQPVVKRESLNNSNSSPTKAGGRKKKEAEPEEVWKWWEEEKRDDGVKWNFLEHRGPVFAPAYEPLPANVSFEYDGRPMKLSQDAEEIACFYAKMLNHDFTSKPVFNDNFFGDWRKAMTAKEKEKITKLKNCNFQHMFEYFQALSEKNKSRTKEEKAALKAENEALMAEYGFCTIDGHKEKIGNFRIEPPGLFRGRGEHPKMGKVKRRVMPEDIMINCARGSNVPEPPAGHRWKEVKHDNAVTWLASWIENVQGQVKYVMLNPSSKLKGEKDWQKYETARRLHKHIDRIRHAYKEEWKSKEMRIRQRGVALYFIDKLALRAGNEKDEDQADTVGCCSLRVEHIQLHKQLNGNENVVVFDFLGKDSIRYYNEVEVEKRVFKNLELFKENKKPGDDLFDRLNTVVMNEHLRELMDGLTAKVFRTYNASWTLQCQLNEMTDGNASLPEKLLAYNRANRAVAVLCNHQRAVPKSHEKSMENLKEKIRAKREQVDDLQVEVKDAAKEAKHGSVKEKMNADKKKKALQRALEQLKKMELQETDRDENKTIALGTSKLNYLDPRISVAWCKKYDVPIDKIYNKTQRDKFRWAIDMATEDYQF